jgi:LuxR family maltose regulon positive regulatory protein
MAAAQAQGRVHRMIRLTLLTAMAQQRIGQIGAAQLALAQALILAAPGGYVRMFLDEGPALVRLLRAHQGRLSSELEAHQDAHRLLERLLASANAALPSVDSPTAAPSLVEPLTKREQKVLAMLADYLSNEQIAKAMFVSDNTVKFHLKNIYSKLGVKTRLEAIRFVKTNGL